MLGAGLYLFTREQPAFVPPQMQWGRHTFLFSDVPQAPSFFGLLAKGQNTPLILALKKAHFGVFRAILARKFCPFFIVPPLRTQNIAKNGDVHWGAWDVHNVGAGRETPLAGDPLAGPWTSSGSPVCYAANAPGVSIPAPRRWGFSAPQRPFAPRRTRIGAPTFLAAPPPQNWLVEVRQEEVQRTPTSVA